MKSAKIHILPEFLMKRIAAGEVVERPASVVKELFENALDAGSSSVSLHIKDSGIGLIQVVDNGDGMTEEDAILCCKRYATSKISRAEDLEAIHTLGFRGEALASISSVSRMSITTRTKNEEEGTQILVEWGDIREVLKVAARKGTVVEVKDLFSNVPARRKYLKSPNTELRHVIIIAKRVMLSYHEVDFSIFIEEDKTIDLRRSSQEDRIKELLGKKKTSSLIPVIKEVSGLSIEGFVSRPGEGRKSRNDQFLFLNRRYIINRSLVHAILSAYGPRLGYDEYPLYIINLKMDPRHFDVNVHPTKIEIRFSDEKFVHDIVQRAIQETLRKSVAAPRLQLVTGNKKRRLIPQIPLFLSKDHGQLTLEVQRPSIGEDKQVDRILAEGTPSLWQLHNRYILSQIKSGLTIIDQHIAHERILYEKALAKKNKNTGLSQRLLFPQTVQIPTEDFLILTEILPYLEKIGFELKEFGKNTVVIEAVPVEIKTGRETELLKEIIDEYNHVKRQTDDTWEAVLKAYACKSAIKSGDRLSLYEMSSLIDQLFATQDPYFCPHGRPIVVNLSLEEIDKRFKR